MLLAVDVGNTNIVMGLFADGRDEPAATMRVGTRRDATADEISLLVEHLARRTKGGSGKISRTCVASVVPQLTRTIGAYVAKELGHEPSVVSSELDLGLELAVDTPREVGADRIVNALAARESAGAPAVVVDLGTATNFDCVDARGRYVGGVIAPGVETSAEDLFRRAARLAKIDLTFPENVIGRNTRDCVRSGILFGAARMIDAMLDGIWRELGATGTAIATGGLAELVGPRCESIDRVDPGLTLRGLVLVDRILRGT
jgi:type III pantothenate kinase